MIILLFHLQISCAFSNKPRISTCILHFLNLFKLTCNQGIYFHFYWFQLCFEEVLQYWFHYLNLPKVNYRTDFWNHSKHTLYIWYLIECHHFLNWIQNHDQSSRKESLLEVHFLQNYFESFIFNFNKGTD